MFRGLAQDWVCEETELTKLMCEDVAHRAVATACLARAGVQSSAGTQDGHSGRNLGDT